MSSPSILECRLELARQLDKSVLGIAEFLVDILNKETTATRISIIMKDQSTGKYSFIHSLGIPSSVTRMTFDDFDSGILHEVKREKKSIFCPNILSNPDFGFQKRLRYKNLSFMIAPIWDGDGENLAGFLCLSDFERLIVEDDFSLVENLRDEFSLLLGKKKNNESSTFFSQIQKEARSSMDSVLKKNYPLYALSLSDRSLSYPSFGFTNVKENTDGSFLLTFTNVSNAFANSTSSFKWFYSVHDVLLKSIESFPSFIKNVHSILMKNRETEDSFSFLGLSFEKERRTLSFLNIDHPPAIFYNAERGTTQYLPSNSSLSSKVSLISQSVSLSENSMLFVPFRNFTELFDDLEKVNEKIAAALRFNDDKNPHEIAGTLNSILMLERDENFLIIKF